MAKNGEGGVGTEKVEKQCLGQEGTCLTLLEGGATSCWKCGSHDLKEIKYEQAPMTDVMMPSRGICPSNSVGSMGDHESLATAIVERA